MGGLSVGLIAIGGLALGLVSPSAGLGAGALYANAGLAIAPHAVGGAAIGRDITAGLPIYIESQTGIILLATSIILVLAAALAAMQKLCPIPASSPTPFRGTRRILVAIAAFLITLLLLLGLFPQTLFSTQAASADIHYRVFEAPAQLIDRLIPPTSRQSAELPDPDATPKSDYSGSPFTASTQTVQVSDPLLLSIFHELHDGTLTALADGARHIDYWPRVADSWSYSFADPKLSGGGSGILFLGVRNEHSQLQLRVEGTVFHSINTAVGLQSYIMWHGNAPPPGTERLFLTPFTRKTGEAEYLIIAYEVIDLANVIILQQPSPPADRFKAHIDLLSATSSTTGRSLPSLDNDLKMSEQQRDAGLITPLQFLDAKYAHDLAVSKTDPERIHPENVRANYTADRLKIIAAQYKAGLATAEDTGNRHLRARHRANGNDVQGPDGKTRPALAIHSATFAAGHRSLQKRSGER